MAKGPVNPLMIVSSALEKPDAESQEWLRRLRAGGFRGSGGLTDIIAAIAQRAGGTPHNRQ
jgi:hypothetical protein